jgi:hypothetical protein
MSKYSARAYCARVTDEIRQQTRSTGKLQYIKRNHYHGIEI